MTEKCTATLHSCKCQNKSCDGIHVCDCGGSWAGSPDGDSFKIYAFPGGSLDPWDTLRAMRDALG